jgi:SRSO17 transposase
VAVSISLASNQGSPPVARQLYLPEDWASYPERRAKARIPGQMRFATKAQIALEQLRTLLDEGAPHHWVLPDAGYTAWTKPSAKCSATWAWFMRSSSASCSGPNGSPLHAFFKVGTSTCRTYPKRCAPRGGVV